MHPYTGYTPKFSPPIPLFRAPHRTHDQPGCSQRGTCTNQHSSRVCHGQKISKDAMAYGLWSSIPHWRSSLIRDGPRPSVPPCHTYPGIQNKTSKACEWLQSDIWYIYIYIIIYIFFFGVWNFEYNANKIVHSRACVSISPSVIKHGNWRFPSKMNRFQGKYGKIS